MTQELVKIWHDGGGYCNVDDLVEWYNCKTQGPEGTYKRRADAQKMRRKGLR